MTEHGPFTVNREDVAAKVIDGELIIIRLSDGTYYSMENVGTQIWELLEGRLDRSAIVQTLVTWYGASPERVDRDVAAIVGQLIAEKLIAQTEPDGAVPAPAAPGGLLAYETPQLNIYRDMGNLLALDPPTPGIDDLLFRDGNAG